MRVIFFIISIGIGSTYGAQKEKSRFESLELFNKVLFLIENQYYRQVDTEVLVQGAIKGMMSTLDPHSTFLDKKFFAKIQEDTSGKFGGLGIEVGQKDGSIVVITPIDDTPAFKAGIRPGDKIVEIDGNLITGMTLEEAIHRMRGKPGSKISVGIERKGNPKIKRFALKREIIKVSAVKPQLLQDQYAYVRLTQFQKNCSRQVSRALQKMRKSKGKKDLKGLILDLRFNPGGLLDEAVNLSSIFLREGIVVSTEGRDPKAREIHYVKKGGYKELDIPMVVLVNGASASASEIVAGALQDAKRALVMGTPTFGKGSVQSVAKIGNERGVKLTIAQYMTPSSKKIQAIGIRPDVVVEEFEGDWVAANRRPAHFVRETDLKNHLIATIETESEKKERLKREKRERQKRKERTEKVRKAKRAKKDAQGPFKRYDPTTDYQVIQAVNYLKSFKLIQNLTPSKS